MKKLCFFSILVCILIGVTGCGNENEIAEVDKWNSEEAALEYISEQAFDTPTKSELSCIANSQEDDGIILVECTTTHDELINYYDSETIWFGYLESADGDSYYRYADSDKDVVLDILRD